MYLQTFLFRMALVAALTIATPFFMTQAQADENLWGYLYGSDTLPAGANELYLWTTSRNQKGKGNYRAWDTQLEFEHGFTDRFHIILISKRPVAPNQRRRVG